MSAVEVYEFSCPACGESIHIDSGIRDRLLETGCVVCGAGVSESDFALSTGGTMGV